MSNCDINTFERKGCGVVRLRKHFFTIFKFLNQKQLKSRVIKFKTVERMPKIKLRSWKTNRSVEKTFFFLPKTARKNSCLLMEITEPVDFVMIQNIVIFLNLRCEIV